MNRKDLILKLLQGYRPELAGMGVHAVGLFGSVARGDDNRQSDVDILVEFEAGAKTFQNFNRVCDFLEQAIGPNLDLMTPEGLSPHIRPFILKEVEYVAIAS
ncbi:MAG: nucleotidyltransferase family protein [Opitutales bacterium]